METRTEYRAIYRTPASFLDSTADQERGYVEHATGYGTDKKDVRDNNYDLRRTEESHAHIARWEKRTVSVGDWEPEAV